MWNVCLCHRGRDKERVSINFCLKGIQQVIIWKYKKETGGKKKGVKRGKKKWEWNNFQRPQRVFIWSYKVHYGNQIDTPGGNLPLLFREL